MNLPEKPKNGQQDKTQIIMVVDDEILNLNLITSMLKLQGYEVIAASGGEECLAKVADNPPDLILMDIVMPQMDGFEVVAALKGNPAFSMIPIVMVTSLQDVADRVKALETGADDFLTKPVDRLELQARVRSLLKVKAYNDHMAHYRQNLESEVAKQTLELKNANLKIADAHAKLREASLEVIFRLARAAEYRDEDTGSHIISMSRISALLTEKMGFNKAVVEMVLYASPMHDIGKIGIPDRILLKNGPLDDEEWKLMRQHTIFGGKILENSNIGFLRLGEVIALSHHEKWDGSGYPKGLKDKEIPMAGRIVAIADVFDALMSRRPYKQPLPREEALEIIKAGSGTHFDPNLVEVFLNNREDIMKLWDDAQAKPHTALKHDNHILDSLRSSPTI